MYNDSIYFDNYEICGLQGLQYRMAENLIEEKEVGLNIFPNPNNGSFSLMLSNGFTIEQIQVLDLAGRTVFQQKLNFGQKQINTQVNLELVSNGLYFVKVYNNITGTNFTERLIINKQ